MAALAFAACNSSGEDSRNHRLALWDAVSGDWRFISPAGRSSNEFEWLPDGSAMLVIEGEPLPDGTVVTDPASVVVGELLRVRVARGDFAAKPVASAD